MEDSLEYRQQLMKEYKQVVLPLLRYMPWLQKNAGQTASSFYEGEGFNEHSMSIPIYDSNLMNFVKEAAKTPLMDRNYLYTYSRNHIKTHEDERKIIAHAGIKEWDILRGILSKYVLGGRTKAMLWSEGVQENIFYLVLKQMQQIIEFWDQPLNIS